MSLFPSASLETEKMYKVDLPVDQSIKKAVDRRGSAETARKARIFNTRLRVMGLDVDALNKQVEEKKHQQHMEMQRDKAFGKVMMRAREGSELNQLNHNHYSPRTQLGIQSTSPFTTNEH